MSTDAHTPVPVRPSAEERERVVRLLRDRSVEGRLSTETFADRVVREEFRDYAARSAAYESLRALGIEVERPILQTMLKRYEEPLKRNP